MMFYTEADWGLYKAIAKRVAGIPGWEEHPYIGSLPDYTAQIAAKMPKVDKSYKIAK
jgi:hypothetical protein